MKHTCSLQNIHSQTTARIHLDNLVFDEFPINRAVRQGDSPSPKLFTSEISGGISLDEEHLKKLLLEMKPKKYFKVSYFSYHWKERSNGPVCLNQLWPGWRTWFLNENMTNKELLKGRWRGKCEN